jgi:hypothetical protein
VESNLHVNVALGRFYALPSGLRVRLRLAQSRDLRRIGPLLHLESRAGDPIEAAMLVRFDPRRRVVICATALIGGAETIVGVGALDVGADTPDALVVDPALSDGLLELLTDALRSRAAAINSRLAA